MSQPTEDPKNFIADVFNELNQEGKITLSYIHHLGHKHNMGERFTEDVLEVLMTEGYIQTQGRDTYVFTSASSTSIEKEAARLAKQYPIVRKASSIPPMKFAPPKPY